LNKTQVAKPYRTAIVISGIVTLIASYHYFRIFNSWVGAYSVSNGTVKLTKVPFNDAYRYVDWLITVPLLLVELILVMRLSRSETVSKGLKLGGLAALMVILGYPGEIASDLKTRWIYWILALIPFMIIVYDLFIGLKASINLPPQNVRGMASTARWLIVLSWCFYPVVFIFPMIGFTGADANIAVQVGYTIADIIAKALFGVYIYIIAVRKSESEPQYAQD
jgi:bacteriorhodopsin